MSTKSTKDKKGIENREKTRQVTKLPFRRYMITVKAETWIYKDSVETFCLKASQNDNVRYLSIGREKPEAKDGNKDSNKPYEHFHAFIVLTKPQRMSWLKTFFEDNSIHVERRGLNSTDELADNYTMKEGEFKDRASENIGRWRYGSLNKDFAGEEQTPYAIACQNLTEDILSGRKSFRQLITEYPSLFVRHGGNIARMIEGLRNERKEQIYEIDRQVRREIEDDIF